MAKIAVIGAGAWGTTLGALAAWNGHEVVVLGRDPDLCAAWSLAHRNLRYLPEFELPAGLRFTPDHDEVFEDSRHIILAVPSEHLAATIESVAPHLDDPTIPMLSSIKGFLDDHLMRVTEGLHEWLGARPVAVVSGPNLAAEVLQRQPAVTVIAAHGEAVIHEFRTILASRAFRIYGSRDVAGVELGGAVKNILAVAMGITRQLGFGMNTQAALISRGLAEMAQLGAALGGERETLLGIAGLGDAIGTCLSPLSRNVQVGERLGRGESVATALGEITGIPEGIRTALHVDAYAREHHLDLPITAGVAQVVRRDKSPREVIDELMDRTWKMEIP